MFKEKELISSKKNFGNLSFIAETFQRCYLDHQSTENYFLNLINKNESEYSRYLYFYLSYLIQKNKFDESKDAISNIEYINSTLLLSQGKSWIEERNFENFQDVFSCQNHNHIIGEFLFLISNLYSSQDDFERSNFIYIYQIFLIQNLYLIYLWSQKIIILMRITKNLKKI